MGSRRNRKERRNNLNGDELFFGDEPSNSRSSTSKFTFEGMIGGGAKQKFKPHSSAGTSSPNENDRKLFTESMESKFNIEINGRMDEYERMMRNFQREYLKWNTKRRETISKLTELKDSVHTDQLAFNNTNLFFKQVNVESRKLKTIDGSNIDFFASVAALITDAASGVTSIAQACNIDANMKTFGEIMDNDAEFTRALYAARSNCFSEYKNVEEIVRRYHTDTFGRTMDKITNRLKVEDMWLDLKSARSGGDNVTQMLDALDNFFKQVTRAEVFGSICKSLENYVDNNPAVLEACESTGKTLYGIYDTWGRDSNKSNSLVSRGVSITTNNALIRREESQICKLRELVINEEEPQAKLESTIRDALESFEEEAKEMENFYKSSISSLSTKNVTYGFCDSY